MSPLDVETGLGIVNKERQRTCLRGLTSENESSSGVHAEVSRATCYAKRGKGAGRTSCVSEGDEAFPVHDIWLTGLHK